MSRKLQYNLVMVVSCLIVVASFIIPRLIFVKPITNIATNATNADIVNAIYSLHNVVDSLKDTIYTASFATMAIQICVILAVMTVLIKKE